MIAPVRPIRVIVALKLKLIKARQRIKEKKEHTRHKWALHPDGKVKVQNKYLTILLRVLLSRRFHLHCLSMMLLTHMHTCTQTKDMHTLNTFKLHVCIRNHK
jgi:hypothetical protein